MNAELGVTIVVVTHDPLVSEQVSRTIAIRDGRTSTETLRRSAVSEAGEHHLVAEEFAVLDRVGRLQLPRDYVDALGLQRRVRLVLEDDHIAVWPGSARSRRRRGDVGGARDERRPRPRPATTPSPSDAVRAGDGRRWSTRRASSRDYPMGGGVVHAVRGDRPARRARRS